MTLLSMLLFATNPAAANGDFMAAGILLVAQGQQSTQVFLVKHHSRDFYEMPGGRRQLLQDVPEKRRETAYETALRECHEETRGFLSQRLLLTVVDQSRSMRDGGFVFFVAEIDWFSLNEIPGAPAPTDESVSGFREIADYAWVPVANLLASDDATVLDIDGRQITVRRQLKSRLARVRDAGWL